MSVRKCVGLCIPVCGKMCGFVHECVKMWEFVFECMFRVLFEFVHDNIMCVSCNSAGGGCDYCVGVSWELRLPIGQNAKKKTQ